MQEISAAIQEGAKAYLNRQYQTIAMVGLIVFCAIDIAFGGYVSIGILNGRCFIRCCRFIGMNMSGTSQCRTAEAAENGLQSALKVAFRAGAVLLASW